MTDQTTIPTEDSQDEMFPKTPREIADEFLEHFQADVEAAEKSVYNARKKLREAQVLRDHAELNLKRAIEAEHGVVESDAEEDYEDAEVMEIEAPPAQIEEGAVVEDEPNDAEPAPGAMVWVAWPGAEESISLEVGPLTRYGEIVANYLNANPDVDFLAKYTICTADGTTYDGKDIIAPESYGQEFFIEKTLALTKDEA